MMIIFLMLSNLLDLFLELIKRLICVHIRVQTKARKL